MRGSCGMRVARVAHGWTVWGMGGPCGTWVPHVAHSSAGSQTRHEEFYLRLIRCGGTERTPIISAIHH